MSVQTKIKSQKPGVVAHAFDPSRGQPGLQSEFQGSQGYTEKPCLENKQTNKQKQKKKTLQIWYIFAYM
jgi:hypothetical protein